MRRSLLCAAGVAVAALAGSAPALHAQGSNVMQHTACMTARAAAGAAEPCDDGSAVLINPAALATQQSVLGLSVAGIGTSGGFTFDTGEEVERDFAFTPVPSGFFNYRFGDGFAAALGVFAPFGLGVDWPVCPADDPRGCEVNFEGRFVGFDNQLRNVFIQPTLAYQLSPWLSVGAGLDFVLSSIEINRRADLATVSTGAQNPFTGGPLTFGELGVPLGTDFAEARLAGDGTGITFNVGAQARLTQQLSLGVRYIHETEIDLEGDAEFIPVSTGLVLAPNNPLRAPGGTPVDNLLAAQFTSGALQNQGLSTSITLPRVLTVGASFTPLESLRFLADYQFTGWESFDAARIDFAGSAVDTDLVLDYQNTHTYLLAGEFGARDGLLLRTGFRYNTAAERDASVSPLLPEAERNYYTLGLGYRLGDALGLDLGYQYVDQSDRRGRVRERSSLSQTADELNVGVYSVEGHVLSGTITYRFGARR